MDKGYQYTISNYCMCLSETHNISTFKIPDTILRICKILSPLKTHDTKFRYTLGVCAPSKACVERSEEVFLTCYFQLGGWNRPAKQ